MVIANNLTSLYLICFVCKEKIVKNESYRRTKRSSPYKFGKLKHSTRIVKKSIQFQTNHSDIIMDNFRRIGIKLIFHNIFYFLYKMQFKRRCSRFFCGSTWQRHLANKKTSIECASYTKQIKYIMKYYINFI